MSYTESDYDRERAICDNADAYWRAHATFGRSGSSLSAELAKHPDYAACDNAMRGRVQAFEIRRDMPERFTAYVSGDGTHITTWPGDVLGVCTLGRGWRVRSWIGSRMYQAYARVNGVLYTGRTFGGGMYINLRRCANQG